MAEKSSERFKVNVKYNVKPVSNDKTRADKVVHKRVQQSQYFVPIHICFGFTFSSDLH